MSVARSSASVQAGAKSCGRPAAFITCGVCDMSEKYKLRTKRHNRRFAFKISTLLGIIFAYKTSMWRSRFECEHDNRQISEQVCLLHARQATGKGAGEAWTGSTRGVKSSRTRRRAHEASRLESHSTTAEERCVCFCTIRSDHTICYTRYLFHDNGTPTYQSSTSVTW